MADESTWQQFVAFGDRTTTEADMAGHLKYITANAGDGQFVGALAPLMTALINGAR